MPKSHIETSESWPEDSCESKRGKSKKPKRRNKKSDESSGYETVYEVELTLKPKKKNGPRSSVSLNNSAENSESWSEVSARRHPKRGKSKKEKKEVRCSKKTDAGSEYENLSSLGLECKGAEAKCSFSEASTRIPSEDLFPEATIKQSKTPKVMYCGSTNSTQSQSSEALLLDMERELLDELFLGVLKGCCVRKYLKVSEFRLYYKMPSSPSKLTPSLPLQIGYMSSDKKVHHFPVLCTNPGTHKQAWYVVTGAKDSQIAAFSTLPALLRYHRIYSYINPKNGTIETFPI